MADKNQAQAQFQTGNIDVVQSVYTSSDSPLQVSDVIRLFDTLASRVSDLKDKKLRAKAQEAIKDMQSLLSGSSGLCGLGLGRNTHKKTFEHDNKEYRVDFELSGEIKG